MLHKKVSTFIKTPEQMNALYKDMYKNVDDLDEELRHNLMLEVFFRTPKVLLYKDLIGQIYYKDITP